MKKGVAAFICCTLCMLLTACGAEAPEVLEENGRVQNGAYTFTIMEFKETYNSIAPRDFRLDDSFSPSPTTGYISQNGQVVETTIYYGNYSESGIRIEARADEENGAVDKVSLSFFGSERTAQDDDSERITISRSAVKRFEKYGAYVFRTCCPNVSSEEFSAYFNQVITDATELKSGSTTIGDITISFDPSIGLILEFLPDS